jgi:hypothetical protein
MLLGTMDECSWDSGGFLGEWMFLSTMKVSLNNGYFLEMDVSWKCLLGHWMFLGTMCSGTIDVSLGVVLETMDVSCESECFLGQWMYLGDRFL